MATILVSPVGRLVWPKLLSPQAATVPSSRRARLCQAPAAIATTFETWGGTTICRKESFPTAATGNASVNEVRGTEALKARMPLLASIENSKPFLKKVWVIRLALATCGAVGKGY